MRQEDTLTGCRLGLGVRIGFDVPVAVERGPLVEDFVAADAVAAERCVATGIAGWLDRVFGLFALDLFLDRLLRVQIVFDLLLVILGIL